MATLTQAQRDALPASAFGDPARRLFPITDQEDVDSAARLIGRARDPEAVKRRIMAICRRKGLTPPAAWMEEASMAAFAAETVIRTGKIFECGEYEDKEFALTPEEALEAIALFQPAPLDLEHTPTVLDGKLGTLEAIDLDEDGKSLIGTVALPKWLDDLLGEGERKVSATWDRAAKALTGLALVRNPRVTDAALMAAFHQAYPPAAEPAVTDSIQNRPAPARPGARKETRRMSLIDRLKALLADETGAEFADPPGGEEKPTETAAEKPAPKAEARPDPSAVFAAEIKALKDQIAESNRRSAEERARRIEAEASSFAEGLVRDGKAVPSENAPLIALFSQAARDDDASPAEVTFGTDSEGQALKGSRVAALRALFAARPTHVLMGEQIPEGAQVLLNREKTKDEAVSDERLNELLGMTPMGRRIVAERGGQ